MSLGSIAKAWAGKVFPSAVLAGGRGYEGAPAAVTFDDGPHPTNTPRILTALAAENVTATFFLQGQEAQRFPGLVRDIHDAGHQVANHAFLHRDARRVPLQEYVDEVLRTQDLLNEIVRSELPLDFRPPYGSTTAAIFLSLVRRGFRFVYWSKDSRDSFLKDPAALAASVTELGVSGGDIVLFHEDYSQTAAALPEILEGFRARSLRLRATADLGAFR